jgi:hypothetical protein
MIRPDATAVASAIRSGALRAVDHARATLDAIDTANPGLNAYHEVFHEAALERAAAVDALIAAGRDPGPLAGVCVAVKDNIATTLGQTTCSSRMLEGYRSPFDATVVTRLVGAGAVIVGKTNMVSSRWVRAARPAPGAWCATRMTRRARPVGRAAARRPRWRRDCVTCRLARTRAAASGSRRPSAASSV